MHVERSLRCGYWTLWWLITGVISFTSSRELADHKSRVTRESCKSGAQGDVLLAERLNQKLTKADGRCSLVATFIHRVVPTLETISSLRSRKSNKAAWLAAWRDANVFFNRTPIGMAAQVPGPALPALPCSAPSYTQSALFSA